MKGIILFEDDYCLLPITYKGHVSWMKVDPDVAAWACNHSWCLRGRTSPYAVSKIKGAIRQLHAMVNQTPAGFDTDHINGRSLDNRRCNLRTASRAENNHNRHRLPHTKSSKWRGVCLDTSDGRWRAGISRNGRFKSLGSFSCEDEAARVYNKAALDFFGPSYPHFNRVPDQA